MLSYGNPPCIFVSIYRFTVNPRSVPYKREMHVDCRVALPSPWWRFPFSISESVFEIYSKSVNQIRNRGRAAVGAFLKGVDLVNRFTDLQLCLRRALCPARGNADTLPLLLHSRGAGGTQLASRAGPQSMGQIMASCERRWRLFFSTRSVLGALALCL